MGRPALNMIRTHVSLRPETIARLDRLVGEKGRAKFIRVALDQMLDAVEMGRKLDTKAKSHPE